MELAQDFHFITCHDCFTSLDIKKSLCNTVVITAVSRNDCDRVFFLSCKTCCGKFVGVLSLVSKTNANSLGVQYDRDFVVK